MLAIGEQGLYDFLMQYQLGNDLPQPLHQELLRLLKIFLITGGMPESVQHYVLHRDFMGVERIKHAMLSTYQDDFSKYESRQSAHFLRAVFERIPPLIAKKIKYSAIDGSVRSDVVARSLQQLSMAKIITMIHHSACNGVPLGAQINEKIFKLIFLDAGLLSTQLDLSFLDLHDCTELNMVHNGIIAEQFIGEHLLYMRPSYEPPSLYYWQRDKKSAQAEIDYVMSYRQHVIPIEVKAGKTGTLKSLHVFMNEKQISLGVKFSSQTPMLEKTQENNTILALPLYMVSQLQRFLLGFVPKAL